MEGNMPMTKKIHLLMLILVMLCMPALGEGLTPVAPAKDALLEAYTNVRFNIRQEPEESSRRLKAVEDGQKVQVFGTGKEWSIVAYDGVMGYCKTKWLYRYRSLQPYTAQVPGAQLQAGIAQVATPVHVSTSGYGGNLLKENDQLTVLRLEDGFATLSIMRSTTQIPAAHLSFTSFVPWDKAEPGDVIGGFTTYYNETTGGKKYSANRRFNIDLAVKRLHGTVVAAGTDFSYNRLCGPYTQENGYKLGPNISSDGVGYGGGVCQLSTTLYNAVLNLPLQITEWAMHRESGVAYIPRGFDAAVGIYSDFSFTNSLPYDIRLEVLDQKGILTVIITRNDTN